MKDLDLYILYFKEKVMLQYKIFAYNFLNEMLWDQNISKEIKIIFILFTASPVKN